MVRTGSRQDERGSEWYGRAADRMSGTANGTDGQLTGDTNEGKEV